MTCISKTRHPVGKAERAPVAEKNEYFISFCDRTCVTRWYCVKTELNWSARYQRLTVIL